MTRLEWILGGVLVVLLAVVAVLLVVFWRSPAGTQDNLTTADSARTALAAYDKAQPVAQSWAEDAVLLTAHATWPTGTTFPVDAANWGFVFYSPGRVATALISVSQGNATLIKSGTANRQLSPAGAGNWQIDSPTVVDTLLANGGQAFLDEQGKATLSLTLDASQHPVWKGTLVNTDTHQAFTLEIDPDNGNVLAQSTAR